MDHLDHSPNRNGGSLKVQSRFKCLKIAFDYRGLVSIFKTTHCRDSQNPEHIAYHLSVTWKHNVIRRQRNAERNWYVPRSYQNYFRANCLLWLTKAMTGLPKTTRLTGVSPCLRTDYGHVHWHRIQKPMSNKPAMGFTWTSGTLFLISQLSDPSALQITKARDTCPYTVTHRQYRMSN